jgi:hypothetical protein
VYVLQVHHQQQQDNQYKKPYKNQSKRFIARQHLPQTTDAIIEAAKVRPKRHSFTVALVDGGLSAVVMVVCGLLQGYLSIKKEEVKEVRPHFSSGICPALCSWFQSGV